MLFTMECEVLVPANGEKIWEVLLHGARMVQGFATADPIAHGKTWSGQVCALPAGHVPQRLLVPALGFTLLQISVRGLTQLASDLECPDLAMPSGGLPLFSDNQGDGAILCSVRNDGDIPRKFRCSVTLGMPADGWRVRSIRVHGRQVPIILKREDGSMNDVSERDLELAGELPIGGDSPLRTATFRNPGSHDKTVRFTVNAERITNITTGG